MSSVLLDTNVIILHLNGIHPVNFSLFTAAISTITVYELLRYPRISKREERAVRELLDEVTIIPCLQLIEV
ncbi:MAG TPA: hypothetical protein VJB65_02200 [Patescibacteria group bacterium]|nr:hypothetical protein [Patescibacteria group bacterium]